MSPCLTQGFPRGFPQGFPQGEALPRVFLGVFLRGKTLGKGKYKQNRLPRVFLGVFPRGTRVAKLPPLPFYPVSGRRHYLPCYGYRYDKNVPLPLSPVSR